MKSDTYTKGQAMVAVVINELIKSMEERDDTSKSNID